MAQEKAKEMLREEEDEEERNREGGREENNNDRRNDRPSGRGERSDFCNMQYLSSAILDVTGTSIPVLEQPVLVTLKGQRKSGRWGGWGRIGAVEARERRTAGPFLGGFWPIFVADSYHL